MFDRDTWQEIFATMKKHKLRTALTALGVFWGIFMLIFVLGMGKGLENGVTRNFGDRAKNVMYTWATRTSLPYQGFQPGRRPQLKLDDIQAIKDNIPEVAYIAPRLSLPQTIVAAGDKSERYEIRGELGDMIRIEALKVYEGRYINDRDVAECRKMAVIGTRVRDVLYGKDAANCVGKAIRIRGVEFTVAGVFGPSQLKPWNEEDQESIVIPLPTMHRAFAAGGDVDYFVCASAPNVMVSDVEPKDKALLRQRHHVAPNDPQGIGGFNLEEEFQQFKNLFTGINAFLWFVGIGTLLAGIVGVSNIMLIIVKERTREIGLRKALGATPRSIISMILTESVFITALSGYLGLLAGTLVVGGLNYIMVSNNMDSENFYNPQVNLTIGLSAMILLVIAGAVAGLIPAMNAARVNPVLALKDE